MNIRTEPAPNPVVSVGEVRFGQKLPLALIAGPCQLESRDHAFEMASALKEISQRLGIGLVYKTSFDKANRTSAKSARGIGLDKSLPIFAELREKFGLPGAHRRARRRAMRAGRRSRRRVANSGVSVPANRSADRRRANRPRRQRQERPVPRAVGHGQCRRENHRRRKQQRAGHRTRRVVRLQHARLRHARIADPGAHHRRAGDFRRHAFGAAAGRAGHDFRRRARIRAGAGARGGRGRRRRRLHRDASGPRQGARRTGPTWCRSRNSSRCCAR